MNEDWRDFFGWSFSKSGLWASCRRQFYFHYVKKHEMDEEGLRVKQLANLTSVKMLSGTIVHQALSNQLMAAAAGGRHSASLAKRFAEHRFEERFGSSTPSFIEDVNDLPLGPDEKAAAVKNAGQCIDNFYRTIWPQIAREQYECCDQGRPMKTSIAGTDVYLNIDYLSLDGPFMVIRDWKTGVERRSYALQVAVYAVHVEQEYLRPIESIRAELVYLPSAKSVTVPLSAPLMDQVKRQILSESRDMLACHTLDDFPTNPTENCAYCNFATICEDGARFLRQ